ncbi:hypothetical protein C8F04DRAFT_523926 [Mycena alexandri]|uniref:VWFA domain-containing protein n=1 Tax=Mycena alexandri TaxID=1745969 RepID=A0AAD6TF69_9AGAR|nr:hypothetical protein C8F04DRAFT_523926 [Mycena alexandri]
MSAVPPDLPPSQPVTNVEPLAARRRSWAARSTSRPAADVDVRSRIRFSSSAATPATAIPSDIPSPGAKKHTNAVIEAARIRSRDEQEMQNLLQSAQIAFEIYNSDIEPEHDTERANEGRWCSCKACRYRVAKQNRMQTHGIWSTAVRYPGEKNYNDIWGGNDTSVFGMLLRNPYQNSVVSPYGPEWRRFALRPKPIASYHMTAILQTINLNRKLNDQAQRTIDAVEPKTCIWQAPEDNAVSAAPADRKDAFPTDKKILSDAQSPPPITDSSARNSKDIFRANTKASSDTESPPPVADGPTRKGNFLSKLLTVISTKAQAKAEAQVLIQTLAKLILDEEAGRWPDQITRDIVANYQVKTGMLNKIKHLRNAQPIQYLHLLRAGYFEPIPVAWADQVSNPLKFSIEAAGGWRGITPSWRGYEDTAEERLYWVLNHREGTPGVRMKPDFISEMNMARDRMASAVEPPPEYFSSDDQCHVQHKTDGYSKQVLPKPFHPSDLPETPDDDTMILLDVSGSMDFDPVRPVYDKYLITGYEPSSQPRNKDVAKAIVRRFTDAMAHHDHVSSGYDLVTFSSHANFVGTVNHRNFEQVWAKIRISGGTRVMTGWQKVKQRHFEKHRESAIWHPDFGWQAGPETPILRLLLLLDGEATDMDEFELDLLGLSWAHVTIFLIGPDGCPHHHRHANELQRISDVNPHVSFVDAQGNTPERYVTHELLKRHLGVDLTLAQFKEMETLPAYSK